MRAISVAICGERADERAAEGWQKSFVLAQLDILLILYSKQLTAAEKL